MDHILGEIQSVAGSRKELLGRTTGFEQLDRTLNGLQPGDLIAVIGAPGVGKTSFVMNILRHVATARQENVLIFSLETMDFRLIRDRLLCSAARLDLRTVRDHPPGEECMNNIVAQAQKLAQGRIVIDDMEALTLTELCERALRYRERAASFGLMAIDYLQLMRLSGGRPRPATEDEIAALVGGIKALAKKLYVPVLLVSQIAWSVASRAFHIPALDDLRDGGAIGEAADAVLALVRPSMHVAGPAETSIHSSEVTLHVIKQRHGPLCQIGYEFFAESAHFIEYGLNHT